MRTLSGSHATRPSSPQRAETRQNFRDVREDIAGLRKETEFEFDDLLGRVKYVEQKLGIESGK
jgi:hypothetical protein